MSNPALTETITGLGMLSKAIQDFEQRGKQHLPALTEALRGLNQLQLWQDRALPPSVRKALESASGSIAASQQPASPPPRRARRTVSQPTAAPMQKGRTDPPKGPDG